MLPRSPVYYLLFDRRDEDLENLEHPTEPEIELNERALGRGSITESISMIDYVRGILCEDKIDVVETFGEPEACV
jgi:hypothetical protein